MSVAIPALGARPRRSPIKIGSVLAYLALIVLAVLFLTPYYLIFRNALLTQPQILSFDWVWLPVPPHFENLTDVLEDPRFRMRGCEVGKHVEGEHCCWSLQSMNIFCPAIGGFDTIDKDIKATNDKGWVEVWQCHCRKVVQGCETDRQIQRFLEHPRDATEIQHSHLLP